MNSFSHLKANDSSDGEVDTDDNGNDEYFVDKNSVAININNKNSRLILVFDTLYSHKLRDYIRNKLDGKFLYIALQTCKYFHQENDINSIGLFTLTWLKRNNLERGSNAQESLLNEVNDDNISVENEPFTNEIHTIKDLSGQTQNLFKYKCAYSPNWNIFDKELDNSGNQQKDIRDFLSKQYPKILKPMSYIVNSRVFELNINKINIFKRLSIKLQSSKTEYQTGNGFFLMNS